MSHANIYSENKTVICYNCNSRIDFPDLVDSHPEFVDIFLKEFTPKGGGGVYFSGKRDNRIRKIGIDLEVRVTKVVVYSKRCHPHVSRYHVGKDTIISVSRFFSGMYIFREDYALK